MNVPDPVDAMLNALIERHRMCPHKAWATLARAAARKGLSVPDMCATAVGREVLDLRERELATAGR